MHTHNTELNTVDNPSPITQENICLAAADNI